MTGELASLQKNILAMRETKELPSFVQVLVTLEGAVAELERIYRLHDQRIHEIKRLEAENERLWRVVREGSRVNGS